MIQLKNLNKYYYFKNNSNFHALKDINLTFHKNEFVAIVGVSGSGKSSLLNILGGLDMYDDGTFYIDGVNVRDYKEKDWDIYRNKKVGFIFQNFNLLPHLTALENVELPLKICGLSKSIRQQKAIEILKKVGLEKQLNKKPGFLSGGEKQRVAIARALVNEPDIILADEPTGQLDSKTTHEILDLIKNLCKGKLVIVVSHMENVIKEYSTRVIRIKSGKIIEDSILEDIDVIYKENELLYSNKFSNISSISIKNMLRRKKHSFILFFVLLISNLLIFMGIMLTSKNIKNDIYYNLASTSPMNLIEIIKDEGFTKDEINNLEEIKNILSISPEYFKSLYLENENPYKKRDLLYDLYSNYEEEEIKTKIIDDLTRIPRDFEILPNDYHKFYLKSSLIGKYPINKNEIILDIYTAIALVDKEDSQNLHSKYQFDVIDNEYIYKLIKDKTMYLYNIDNNGIFTNVIELKVVGIVDRTVWNYSSTQVYISNDLIKDLLTIYNKENKISKLKLYLYDIDPLSRNKTKQNILKVNLNFEFNEAIENCVLKEYTNLSFYIKFIQIIDYIFIGISFIGIYLIINYDVITRKREIGILKSIGASLKTIRQIFVLEIVYYTIICFVLSLIISQIILHILFNDLYIVLISSIFWIFIILIGCFLLINKMSRLDIVNILRNK